MAEIKTKANDASVENFLNQVKDEQKRKDSFVLVELMKKITGTEPKMWGSAIIGFGQTTYKSPKTGREVEWFYIGFSPRKAALSIYLTSGLKQHEASLRKLGKHKTSVGCLYINRLADVDVKTLESIFSRAVKNN